jgi:Skp family chaperone for outer membrane proteins
LSRTDSESSDVKIAPGTGWVRTAAHQAAVPSGLFNSAEAFSSDKVDSPQHREPLQDAQRDLVRQLQEENAELAKQLRETQSTASTNQAQLQQELDNTRQKLNVMKEQLMTGQADAEETGRQILEQATQEMIAKHALELHRVNAKVRIKTAPSAYLPAHCLEHLMTRSCSRLRESMCVASCLLGVLCRWKSRTAQSRCWSRSWPRSRQNVISHRRISHL